MRRRRTSKTIINLDFLRSDSAQSTMRIVILVIGIAVALNLVALPWLLYFGIKTKATLSWIPGYVAGLGGLSGAGLIGKALQKRYETNEYDSYRDYPEDNDFEEQLPKGPNGEVL